METVLITGGAGLVGRHLSKKLLEKGYNVAVFSRRMIKGKAEEKDRKGTTYFYWDVDRDEIGEDIITKADYIIHLAGANIGEKRWTNKRKKIIIDSRVKPAHLIFTKIKNSNHNLKAFISASAIGYYGAITSEKIYSETDPPYDDFLGTVCQKWEQASFQFKKLDVRTVVLRTGLVLAGDGGALERMKIPVKLGVGSAIGKGNQYMPWIHIDDLCNIYIKAIEDAKMTGIYNAVAPEFNTNKEFMRALALSFHKPYWFPNVPKYILKLLFGEMSTILLLGSRVSSEKIINAGFIFQYPHLKTALHDLF